MQSEPGPSVQPRVRHDRRHGRRGAPRSPRGPAPAPSRGAGPPRPAWAAPPGPMGGGLANAGGPPAAIGGGPPGPIGGGPGNCANTAVGANEIVASVTLTDSVKSVFLDIIVLRFRFAFQGPAPARPARESGSTNGCRAPGQRSHALAGPRRDRGGSGTTPHRAPAGTTASAACRR